MIIFNTPILPRLRYVELHNYEPLFSSTIKAKIQNNRLLVIGGNGLGKTTILQSIVYCLAGEADTSIEVINKSKRWGRNYFQGRIQTPDDAYVHVEFSIAGDNIVIERGFKTNKILSLSINDNLPVTGANANSWFESYLKENAGYQSLDDFRFIVHKLCYLPEDRTNLVWDSEVQTRLIMILFSDLIDEAEFSEQRKQLKQLDSRARHIHVDLKSTEQALEEYKKRSSNLIQDQTIGGPDDYEIPDIDKSGSNVKNNDATELAILRRLSEIAKEKEPILETIRTANSELSNLVLRIEEIQMQLSEIEEAYILSQLEQVESDDAKLAMHKLIHLQLCPVCGDKADELSKMAQRHIQNNACPLCGSQHLHPTDLNGSPLLDAQLSELVQQRFDLEKKLINARRSLETLISQESSLNFEYNRIKLTQAIDLDTAEDDEAVDDTTTPQPTDEGVMTDTPIGDRGVQLENKRIVLEREYLDYINRFESLKNELEGRYIEFSKIADQRITRLGELYKNYATQFLGMPCELVPRVADIKFLSLHLYVPRFNGQIRERPETCSEAQRFFLDIAFRMSLIDLAKELSKTEGSFICETPENALDVVYIDNVALMFRNFCQEGHSLIATANLQGGGLAGPILNDIPNTERKNSILNLLEFAKLSDVQEKHISALKGILREQIINFVGSAER